MTGDIRKLCLRGARAGAVLMAAGLSACLAACGSISEQTASSAFTSPGKYDIYTCQDIADLTLVLRKKQIELEQLMARSSQGAGGEFVNAIAYRSDYAQTRADLAELSRAAADKQCAIDSKFSSGRALF